MTWRKREKKHLFPLGRIVATPAAIQLLDDCSVDGVELLERHVTGDWGEVCEEDANENSFSVGAGNRILSVYPVGNEKIWVITEADRNVTTLLLPCEY